MQGRVKASASRDDAAGRARVLRLQRRVGEALATWLPAAASGAVDDDLDALRHRSVRLIMRLMFVLYAEAHGLLPITRPEYHLRYGLGAEPFRQYQGSLVERVRRLFSLLHHGDEALGLAPLGGELFGHQDSFIPEHGAEEALGGALRCLCVLPQVLGDALPMPWRALAPEELGHAYEALLQVRLQRRGEAVEIVKGQARRSAGAHYTPRSLSEPIAAITLAPLIEPLLTMPPREAAKGLLSLRVCDMAMGAGALLVEAARCLSEALISVEGGDDADPHRRLSARRRVVEACIYGVDRDPLAVEMARLTLWAFCEASGLPLSTFDHRLRCGDALLGLDTGQLRTLCLQRRRPDQAFLFEPPVGDLITEALALRARLAVDPLGQSTPAASRRALQAAAAQSLKLLKLVGDVLVAAHFGAKTDAARQNRLAAARIDISELLIEWRALGGEGPLYGKLKAHTQGILAARRPLHWPVAFPEVFLDPERPSGFDAIIGNPPFASAISKATGREAAVNAFLKAAYPDAARGSFDVAAIFMVAASTHLREGGCYGVIQPRSTLSQRSALASQAFMMQHAPLDVLLAPQSADLFPGASVYIAVAIGRRRSGGGAQAVRVTVGLDPAEGADVPVNPKEPWWALVTGLDRPPLSLADTLTDLSQWVEARAGCTTAVAYQLREQVIDSASGHGPRLITTGLIDRHTCLWGAAPARFLKGRFEHPRWPSPAADPPRPLRRAMEAQRGPKVLVAGLSRRVEAFADVDGLTAGVVSTHVLKPRASRLDPRVVAAVVSSWVFSYEYMRRFGAKRMGNGNWTIGKKELLSTPVPGCLADAAFQSDILALLNDQGAPAAEGDEALQWAIAGAYGVSDDAMGGLKQWYHGR